MFHKEDGKPITTSKELYFWVFLRHVGIIELQKSDVYSMTLTETYITTLVVFVKWGHNNKSIFMTLYLLYSVSFDQSSEKNIYKNVYKMFI